MTRRLLPAFCLLAVWPLLGADIARSETPRVVSVGGAVTEIVYALGLSDRIVAVDSTSLFPEEAKGKPNVGYMRRLAPEPILALEPTLVLAVEDAGPPRVLQQLREAGVPVAMVPDQASPAGVLDKIARVASLLGAERKGEALAARLEAEFASLAAVVERLPARPRVLFLLSIGRGAPLAAGRDTAAAAIIELAGGINAVDAYDGYKPLSPEAAVAASPDVLLVSERSLRLLDGRAGVLRIPEIALTPAGRARRVVAMDGLLLLGFGPRTGEAIGLLAQALHPRAVLPAPAR